MSKKKGNIFGKTVQYEKKHKGTSIGRITSRSKIKTMNKSKKHVVIVECILIEDPIVVCLKSFVLKIFMFAEIGVNDIFKDNGINYL